MVAGETIYRWNMLFFQRIPHWAPVAMWKLGHWVIIW